MFQSVDISQICVAILLGGASYMDITTKKISNKWLIFWAVVGLVVVKLSFVI